MMPTRCTTAFAPRMRVVSAPPSASSPGTSSTPRLWRVGAGRAEGVEHVGGAEDAGADRDLLPAQAVWVARAIPSLMVVAHCRDDVAKVCERREDLGPDDDVLLDVLELFGGERTLLVQDRFARSDLADVVQ